MSRKRGGAGLPSSELPNTTMETACACGRQMTVKVTFGRPTTFVVVEGHHDCPAWESTCRTVIAKAEGERAASCPLSHDWRDAHSGAEPTPGCPKCEERLKKLARIEDVRESNAEGHREAARRGLLDEEED
jgi:hypothetical protein